MEKLGLNKCLATYFSHLFHGRWSKAVYCAYINLDQQLPPSLNPKVIAWWIFVKDSMDHKFSFYCKDIDSTLLVQVGLPDTLLLEVGTLPANEAHAESVSVVKVIVPVAAPSAGGV